MKHFMYHVQYGSISFSHYSTFMLYLGVLDRVDSQIILRLHFPYIFRTTRQLSLLVGKDTGGKLPNIPSTWRMRSEQPKLCVKLRRHWGTGQLRSEERGADSSAPFCRQVQLQKYLATHKTAETVFPRFESDITGRG